MFGSEARSCAITAAELLAGVTDVDGPPATITSLTIQSGHGTLTQVNATTWSYTPAANDATGVTYADQVLARAIGWSQHGFCINCGVDVGLVEAVHAAYGAPVLAALTQSSAATAARRDARPRPARSRR